MLPMFSSPMFCLGGNIYPVDPDFDWSGDKDVLVDALRETHEALRFHQMATRTPSRGWLRCECVDPAEHRDVLMAGHLLLANTVLTLDPAPFERESTRRRAPVNSLFLRAVQAVAFLSGIFPLQTFVS